jgi:hypothetical protein
MFSLSTLINGQQNLLILLSAFLIGGIFKSQSLFAPVFSAVVGRLKSKRLGLMLVSIVGGCLPVEGRVSISAPILDSLVSHGEKNDHAACCGGHGRGKMGILDFVSNHHYYMWSPLEKPVILMMATLGLTYAQVLSYMALPIALYLAYLLFLVFSYVKEDDIVLAQDTPAWSWGKLFPLVPFVAGIAIALGPEKVFPFVALFYIAWYRPSLSQLAGFIKWKTVLFVAIVIAVANVVKLNEPLFASALHLDNLKDNLTPAVLSVTVVAGFLLSLTMGSSGKFAGMCVMLTLLFGLKYLPIIFMAEFAGYLLSPFHNCLAISATYFKTRAVEFYKYVGGLAAVMVASGFLVMAIQ